MGWKRVRRCKSTANKLFNQLDRIEEQIKEKEREYREIVEALTGGSR